jgi:hypothetical protein
MNRIASTLFALLLVFFAAPALGSAHEKGTTYVPPGVSGASQYVEVVPSAGGPKPASSTQQHQHQTTGVVGGGSGSGGGGTGGGTGSAISPATVHALDSQGSAGTSAASLAVAGAPAAKHRASTSQGNSGSGPKPATLDTGKASGLAAGQVLKTAVGASGGMGAVLPLILIGSLVIASGIGIVKIRRAA